MNFLNAIVDMAKTRITNQIIFAYREYITLKHDKKSDICVLSGTTAQNAPRIRFDTSHAEGVVSLDSIGKLRRMVGENVLRLNGLPVVDEAPYVYLLPTPSAIKTMGLRNFIKYYKDDWTGDSKVGGLIVVKYR